MLTRELAEQVSEKARELAEGRLLERPRWVPLPDELLDLELAAFLEAEES